MIVLFLFIPLVVAKRQLIRAPGMYPPEEMTNDVPTMPRNPYQMNMVQDDDGSENYQFYYEKEPSKTKPPGLAHKPASTGPTPPSLITKPGSPMYINESPRSPAPAQDVLKTNSLGHADDSDRQPDSFYDKGDQKGPTPPHGSSSSASHEYIGWTPLPKSKSSSGGDDKGPPEPPLASDVIRAPATPKYEKESMKQKTSKYEHALARSRPSPVGDPNASDSSGKTDARVPGSNNRWKSSETKATLGMDEFPPNEQDNTENEYSGNYERKQDKQHLSVGRTSDPGSRGQRPGAKPYSNRNTVEEGRNSGTAEVVGTSKSQWLPDDPWKKSTKYESVLKNKGPTTDDTDILKVGAKCCPCCRQPRGSSLGKGAESRKHSGGHVSAHSGTVGGFQAQQREVTPLRSNKFVDDLEKISTLGDTFEQGPKTSRASNVFRQTDASGSIPRGISSGSSVRVEPAEITASADVISPSHGTIETFSLQRSVPPSLPSPSYLSPSPDTPLAKYVTPIDPSTSGSFPAPQPFIPLSPQPYSPAVSYASPGGGCPCAAPPPPPCCAPVQPCCLPSLPCCPPPPPVQCCPQPPVCCQPPPPPCCPPPPVCCPAPVIPTCFRACPACPCRRRLHAALRMKRSPGLNGQQCQQCTAAGQPKYVTRVKRQSNCRSCSQSSNPLLSLFAPLSPPSSCSACSRSDTRAARVKRMGCLPCGKRKKRDIEEEHHRRVKRMGCLPCFGRKKRSPISSNCKQCSNLGQVLHRFKRTIGCSPCGRKKREAKKNDTSNTGFCPCLRSQARTFLLGRKKRGVDSGFDSTFTCDKSCCDYDRCHEISARRLHFSLQKN